MLCQAEEAQRLKKRKKAETLRLLDMEKRQKQRLEEMRQNQKKVLILSSVSFFMLPFIYEIFVQQFQLTAAEFRGIEPEGRASFRSDEGSRKGRKNAY
jgi:hypothetical protein